ncbi:MAG: 50S ribosomal protein L21 [Candidatus Koribacter versatilis]|uniref:Large ribosomal subunit protein bL21 n=1 Tax=Candidatus Korobacter versatilis TaxID=658062 RepID=A0A932A7Y0_9BACT|nr:50S ribosomal protein L21 [Candidatus Koribacter versatilis]
MYAVIRAGGKQYRVAPGDVIRVEKTPASNGKVEFTDVLAVSGQEGQIGRPESGARVVGSVVEEGRADKIIVFHFKRKKQYKKLAGHRQPFTAVRITEIAFDGQKFTAPDEPAKEKKAKPAKAEAHSGETHEKKTSAAKHAASKHAAAKHAAKKHTAKKADHKKKK